MVVHYPRERLRYNSERPSAVRDVLVATSPCSYRSSDIPLGIPTASARTRRGPWALYPSGEQVVVAHPGGAVVGPPAQVAAALDGLLADGRDPLARQVVRAMRLLLRGDPTAAQAQVRGRRWSRPAVGYWISGPDNAQRTRHQRALRQAAPPRRIGGADGDKARPVERRVPAEPPLQPAA
jgi:hypothetical protein